jgi:hypothetical protein
MARRRQSCHASLARCSQNLRRHIACRGGADRWSTTASLEAGHPVGHRPSVDRNHRLHIGCCRSRSRRRSIPGCQAGNCLSIDFAAKTSRMIPPPTTKRKFSIYCGLEQQGATERRGAEATGSRGQRRPHESGSSFAAPHREIRSKRPKQVSPPGTDRPTAHHKA